MLVQSRSMPVAAMLVVLAAATASSTRALSARRSDQIELLARRGGVDTRFGSHGLVVSSTAPGESADYQKGLAVLRDGKILVGGMSDMGEQLGGLQWRITRYTRRGDVDMAFGLDGTVLTSMSSEGGFDERMVALAVQRDGKIVAAGSIQIGPDPAEDASALARYHADGTLDTGFGNGGIVVVDIAPGHDFVTQVLIDDDSRIVVGGGCQHFFLARYRSDGRLDQSFNRDGPRPGVVITDASVPGEGNTDEILGLAIDEHGRIVAGGYSTALENGQFDISSTLARYLPNGTLDPTFNPQGDRPGIVVSPMAPAGNWDVVFRVAVDRHGRIVAAGDAFVGVGSGGYDIALSRYLPDGRPDRSFGRAGTALLNAGPGDSDDDVQGLVIEKSGEILIGGSAAPTAFTFDSDFMVARFKSDGSLDNSFGIVKTPTGADGADDEIWAMALQDESRLIASGECDQPSTGRDVCLVRYELGSGASAGSR